VCVLEFSGFFSTTETFLLSRRGGQVGRRPNLPRRKKYSVYKNIVRDQSCLS